MKAIWLFLKQHLVQIFVAITALIAPAKTVILAMLLLVVLDLVLGLSRAWKVREPITSRKLKRSLWKVAAYFISIIVAALVENGLLDKAIPCVNAVALMIGLIEVKSINENLKAVFGMDLLGFLLVRLGAKKEEEAKQLASNVKESDR